MTSTISDEHVRQVVRALPKPIRTLLSQHPQVVVAGGFVRDTIAGLPVHDIDLFLVGPAEECRRMSDRIRMAFPEPVFITQNAITWRMPWGCVQLITRWRFEHLLQLVQEFDFSACAAVVGFDVEWYGRCHTRFYQDLAARWLHYTNPVREEEPGGSMLRALKFLRRGWRIDVLSLAGLIERVTHSVGIDKSATERLRDISRLLYEVDPSVAPMQEAAPLPEEPE